MTVGPLGPAYLVITIFESVWGQKELRILNSANNALIINGCSARGCKRVYSSSERRLRRCYEHALKQKN